MKFIDSSKFTPEQQVIVLEKENAALKLQLEKRQNIKLEDEYWERIGNYAVYLKVVVSEIPASFKREEYESPEIISKAFGDFFECSGLLIAQLLHEKVRKQQQQIAPFIPSDSSGRIVDQNKPGIGSKEGEESMVNFMKNNADRIRKTLNV